MSLLGSSFRIPLKIGAVCGPTFGLFDISGIEYDSDCHVDLLKRIPVGLIGLSQVLVMMHPDQAKKHRCSDEECAFAHIDSSKIPQVDFICRAWFPNEEYDCAQWKEASISIGGAMVVARHLQIQQGKKDVSWKIAFWCQSTATWEILEVFSEEYEFMCAVVHRTDFRPPNIVYKLASNTIASLGLEDKAEIFLQTLKKPSKHTGNQKKPNFSLTVFADRYKNIGARKNLEANPQLIPFLPIFVGELHNVVPVGHFLRNILLGNNRYIMKSLQPHTDLIEELRHMPNRSEIQEKVLKYFGIVKHWKQKEIFQDYPLHDTGCGWTFFSDAPPKELLSLFPKKFFTIEPGTPIVPPFGNSASGALASAVARTILYPGEGVEDSNYRGKTYNEEKPWGERFFGNSGSGEEKSLTIWKNEEGLWVIRALVHMVGQYTNM